jgi:hypothetical protein
VISFIETGSDTTGELFRKMDKTTINFTERQGASKIGRSRGSTTTAIMNIAIGTTTNTVGVIRMEKMVEAEAKVREKIKVKETARTIIVTAKGMGMGMGTADN